MTDPGRVRKLADRFVDRRRSSARVSGEALMIVAHALRVYADTLERPRPDRSLNDAFVVQVEDRNGHAEEVLAQAATADVARAAFAAACQARPGSTVVLKHGIRLMEERKAEN